MAPYQLTFPSNLWDDCENKISFWANLHRRYPLLLPYAEIERLRVNNAAPKDNFLVLLHSPALREVRTACEGDESGGNSSHGVLWRQGREPVGFSLTHPRPQMDIAGLTLKEWLDDSTRDLWWPEESGVVELDVSAEEMKLLVEKNADC